MGVTFLTRTKSLVIGSKSDRTIKSSRIKHQDPDIQNNYNSELPIRYNQLGNNSSTRKTKDKMRMKEHYQDLTNIEQEHPSGNKYQEYMDNDINHHIEEDHEFNHIIISSQDQKAAGNFRNQKKMSKQELKRIEEYNNQNSHRNPEYRYNQPQFNLQNRHIDNDDISDNYLEGGHYVDTDSRRVNTDLDLHPSTSKDYFPKKNKGKKLKLKVGIHGRKVQEEVKEVNNKKRFEYEYLLNEGQEGYEHKENYYKDPHNIEHSFTPDLEEGKFLLASLI